MPKFIMIFLYVSGLFLFGVCFLGALMSFFTPEIRFAQAFGGMIVSATIMFLGAILQVLREIAANTKHHGF